MKLRLLPLVVAPLLAQPPVHVDYTCPAQDIDSFGLACTPDRPCPVFFELSAIGALGPRLFVAGDIHTDTTTLYGVLLSTDDNGASWEESIPRLRSTTFDQFQFIGDHGWLTGQRVDPLAKDPFFLLTDDGGKFWRRRALFDDARFGSITQFWFESPTAGRLIFDDSVGKETNRQIYQTMTGGESWEVQQSGAPPLKTPLATPDWTATAPPGSPTYLIEHLVDGRKQTVARFLIHIGDCK